MFFFSISAVLQILVERSITAVRRLVPKGEQLEVDVNDIRDNMNQLTNKVSKESFPLLTKLKLNNCSF